MTNTTITPNVVALAFTGVLCSITNGVNTARVPVTGALVFSANAPTLFAVTINTNGVGGKFVGSRTDSLTNEQILHSGRCRLYAVYPEDVLAGTITIRDTGISNPANGPTKHSCAAALAQTGKVFGGIEFMNGISIQLSNSADRVLVTWESF